MERWAELFHVMQIKNFYLDLPCVRFTNALKLSHIPTYSFHWDTFFNSPLTYSICTKSILYTYIKAFLCRYSAQIIPFYVPQPSVIYPANPNYLISLSHLISLGLYLTIPVFALWSVCRACKNNFSVIEVISFSLCNHPLGK